MSKQIKDAVRSLDGIQVSDLMALLDRVNSRHRLGPDNSSQSMNRGHPDDGTCAAILSGDK